MRNWGEALKEFDLVERKYPNSNKRVSAAFAKGMIFKRLNVREAAKETFKRILETYPGSPESFRASSELRLLSRGASRG
jgi:TolA-binding protein